MQRTIALLAATFLAGCAGDQAARETATVTASILGEFKASVDDFVAGQNRANAVVETRLQQFKQASLEASATVQAQLAAWKLAKNEDALALFNDAPRATPDAVLTSILPLASLEKIEPAKLQAIDEKTFSNTITALTALQAKESFTERLTFLYQYGTAVNKGYTEAVKKAANGAAAASPPAGPTSPTKP